VINTSIASAVTTTIDIIEIFRAIPAMAKLRAKLRAGFEAAFRASFSEFSPWMSYGRRRPFYNHGQHFFSTTGRTPLRQTRPDLST
jgi:hypothetical protein